MNEAGVPDIKLVQALGRTLALRAQRTAHAAAISGKVSPISDDYLLSSTRTESL